MSRGHSFQVRVLGACWKVQAVPGMDLSLADREAGEDIRKSSFMPPLYLSILGLSDAPGSQGRFEQPRSCSHLHPAACSPREEHSLQQAKPSFLGHLKGAALVGAMAPDPSSQYRGAPKGEGRVTGQQQAVVPCFIVIGNNDGVDAACLRPPAPQQEKLFHHEQWDVSVKNLTAVPAIPQPPRYVFGNGYSLRPPLTTSPAHWGSAIGGYVHQN